MDPTTPSNHIGRTISGLASMLGSSLSMRRRVDDDPDPPPPARSPPPLPHTSIFDRSPSIVVGVLLKSVGLGWKPRLFVLQAGVLKYYKVYGPTAVNVAALLDALRQGGQLFTVGAEVSVLERRDAAALGGQTDRAPSPARLPPARMEIHMQVGSVRESNADGRKLHVHSGTATLTLRAETQDDRWVWAEALRAAKVAWDGLSPAAAGALRREPLPAAPAPPEADPEHAAAVRAARERLAALGAGAEAQTYVAGLLDAAAQRHAELAAAEAAKRRALLEVVYRLEDEKRQLETALVVEGQRVTVPPAAGGSGASGAGGAAAGAGDSASTDQQSTGEGEEEEEEEDGGGGGAAAAAEDSEAEDEFFECEAMSLSGAHSRSSSAENLAALDGGGSLGATPPSAAASPLSSAAPAEPPPAQLARLPDPDWLATEGPAPRRRDRLPAPQQREKSVSLWSLIKEMVGKDLTRVCLPVYFNEPLSALQKTAEELEYSELLDAAAAAPHGSVARLLSVVAFAVSAYSSTVGRTAKPFNPLLGETYELVHVEKGFRFIAEKVSHHPTIIAAAAEGRGWRLEADADVKSRFWGRSIELKPEGVLRLAFHDGDEYAWNKVTTSINNLILGKIYVDHGGIMRIRSLDPRGLAARVRFKETAMMFDRDPRQVRGFLERGGRRLERPVVHGHWDDALFAELEDGTTAELWRKAAAPPDPTRYNLTAWAIQLNELTPGLEERVAPTDCRLRPDQAHTERGQWDEANGEKQRLEHKQRAARRAAEAGEPLRPRWFEVLPAAGEGKRRDPNELAFKYKGGYWEARAGGEWEGCRDIFGPLHDHQA